MALNGLLELHIVDAHLTKPKDTFAQVYVDGKKRGLSHVRENSQHPVWNLRMNLLLENTKEVQVIVQSKGLFRKKEIGRALLPALTETAHPKELNLTMSPGGNLRVRYTFTLRPHGKPNTREEALRALVFGLPVIEDEKEKTLRLSSDHAVIELQSNEKNTKIHRMLVTNMWEVRLGDLIRDRKEEEVKTLNFRTYPDRDRWVMIVHGHGWKQTKLTMKNLDDVHTVKLAAEALTSPEFKLARTLNAQEIWMKHLWTKFDVNFDGNLNVDELAKLLEYANHTVSKDELKKRFNEASASNVGNQGQVASDGLDFAEFKDLFLRLVPRAFVRELFDKYATEKSMGLAGFKKFLQEEQGETGVTDEYAQSLINNYVTVGETNMVASTENLKDSKADGLSYEGFLAYIDGPDNNGFDPAKMAIYQDMNQPLSYYWIDSSHNTYLTEDQLKGPSSLEAYIRALRSGCRCVELDCWDGDAGEPIVYHGHTMTSKILYKDIIQACKEHAFVASPYPVILSLENHCGVEQQVLMAKHLKEILGDALYMTPPDESATHLPSPEFFKHKFLVKGKKSKPPPAEGAEAPAADDDLDDDDDDEPEEVKKAAPKEGAKKKTQAPELSEVVTHVQGVHFYDFATSKVKEHYYQMSSFGESKTEKLAQDSPNEFIEYNERQLSRIYPGGQRVNSSNYDPTFAWNVGCQIVALNYQTHDRGMQLLRGRFRANGGTGYVLKPSRLITLPVADSPTGNKTLRIKIISGNRIPKPKLKETGEIIDPYVKIEICGAGSEIQVRTKHIDNAGLNAIWNEEFDMAFPAHVAETGLLRVAVFDDDKLEKDDPICGYVVPLDCLRTGYRNFPMFLMDGLPVVYSNLFVHLSWV
eukprot:comp22947_c1_seq1/m.36388 comp22947_c1_seq1/g.36388  ORF comp22947_c1_seq1/g.36388 comp22947_c1_seq1/m.36388 type:complete len:869 (-) comp22947_c1_seq1:38-2644(-)